MIEANGQEIASRIVDRSQVPISVARPEPRAPQLAPFPAARYSARDRSALTPATEIVSKDKTVEMPKDVGLELEEFFEGVVDEVTDEAVQLRTTSSLGEEGIAWLELSRIPTGERKYVELGAPVRVSILMRRDGTNKREHHIRVLRPFQWRPQATTPVAAFLLEQMKAVLG